MCTPKNRIKNQLSISLPGLKWLKPLNFDHQKRLKLAKIKKAPLFYGKNHFKGFILEMLLNDSLMMTKAVIIG